MLLLLLESVASISVYGYDYFLYHFTSISLIIFFSNLSLSLSPFSMSLSIGLPLFSPCLMSLAVVFFFASLASSFCFPFSINPPNLSAIKQRSYNVCRVIGTTTLKWKMKLLIATCRLLSNFDLSVCYTQCYVFQIVKYLQCNLFFHVVHTLRDLLINQNYLLFGDRHDHFGFHFSM